MLKEIVENNKTVKPNSDLINLLKENFPQFFDTDGNFNHEKFSAELKENNIAESKDGYRLSFVGKDYARLQTGRASETLIQPDTEHNSKKENADSQNIFITGDNLEALRHLQNAYRGKVKMIYIDPPYNTGKECVYNDRFEFADDNLKSALGYSDEEIERLKSIQGKRSHSAWLTFMYPRLKLAQKLLTDDGVIFISIDDNEQANLKLLMDDVFGEGNFVAKFDWRKKTGANDAKDIAVITETIYLYAKNHSATLENGIWARDENSINQERYRLADEFVYTRGKYYFDTLDRGGLQYSDSMNYGIEAPDGGMIFPNGRSTFVNDGWIWKWGQEKVKWGLENKFLEFVKSDKSKGSIYTIKYKVYQNVDNEGNIRQQSGRAYSNLITDPINQQGNADFSNLFEGKTYFSNPKPIGLIKYFLKIINDKSLLILDFFAGSATTAHAVMQLNEDGGNRKFIMVQLDEPTNPDSEAKKAGYHTIDEISRERIMRAANQIRIKNDELQKEKAGKLQFNNTDNNVIRNSSFEIDLGFKHYRLTTPTIESLDKITEFSTENLFSVDMISEMGGLDTILTTWLIDGGNTFDTKVEEIALSDYTAHYVAESKTLYLISEGFNTEALKTMLNKIGIGELPVSTIVVYPYSFGFEIMRELEIGIKSLDHAPQIIKKY